MRLVGFALIGLLAATSLAQIKEIDAQKKSLERLPSISYSQVERCVNVGDPARAASVQFGTPGTGKKSLNPFSSATSYSWPTPGMYRESAYSISGQQWKATDKSFGGNSTSIYDGKSFFDVTEHKGKRSIYYRDRSGEHPSITEFFSIDPSIARLMKVTATSTHPDFGPIVRLEGGGQALEIATDRDSMTVYIKDGPRERWVQKIEQIEGHWIPTLIKSAGGYRSPVDIYEEITNIKPIPEKDRDFSITPKPGDFIVKNNVYYNVDAKGKMVVSKNQPDRTTEYASWVGMGIVAFAVICIIVVGIAKLAHSRHHMPMDER